MKRKHSVILTSILLVIQLFFYQHRVIEQKKEAKVPTALATEIANPKNTLQNKAIEVEQFEKEKMNFVKNPVNEYYQLNPDYVGWLTIEETAIDYPVVRGLDNDYYLNHNFYREDDLLGAIFMDYRNVGMGRDKHSVLYGHYSKHGQMFKDLDRYLSEEFLTSHPEFTFSDAFSDRTYKVFSVHHSYADPTLINLTFENSDFIDFTESLKSQSLFSIDTSVSSDDKILTLVTCNYTVDNGRLFIHAVEQTK